MSGDDETKYTVFIKVPFPRGSFVDPPDPDWSSKKDQELWKTLSSTTRGKEIDWEALAQRFQVSIQFLVQQAAWLYENQLSQVREQLRRFGKNPSGASPTPSTSGAAGTPTGGFAMRRGGSTGSRVPSSLSVRQRRSVDLRGDGSTPSTPVQGRVPYSRTASKETITQLPHAGSTQQGTGESPRPKRTSVESRMRETQVLTRAKPDPTSPSTEDSSSSSSSSPAIVTQSRAFARRPAFGSPKSKSKAPLTMLSSGDEDEEDDSPAFLPYSEPKDRDSEREGAATRAKGKQAARPRGGDATDPSASSSQSLPSPAPPSSSIPSISSPTSNPTRPAMAALSPRQRRLAQEGSEGTPSMGSSFSDLDEASLTQSALEEALAREMKAGKGSLGVVSRVGGLWKGQGPSARRPG